MANLTNVIPDISHHNGAINWAEMVKHIPFIILKGTQRTDFVSPTLDTYIRRCEEYKIPYWIYLYAEKGNEKTQAEFLVRTCKPLIGSYFVGYILDAEEGNQYPGCLAAMEVLVGCAPNKTGKAMFYGGYDIWKRLSAIPAMKDICYWQARYGLNNGTYLPIFPPKKECALHQYTDNGKVPYISGTVDLNRLTGVKKLTYFTDTGATKATPVKTYTGEFPKLPSRGYFKKNDGIVTLTSWRDEIKKLQKLLNWANNDSLILDGKFGKLTEASVKMLQEKMGIVADGLFGPKSLAESMKYVKA